MTSTTLDWNWFFSAFSQCGAAIIAIIGGFAISKLIDSGNKLNICLEEFKKMEIDYSDLVNRIKLIEFNKYYYYFFYSAPLIYCFINDNRFKDKNEKIKKDTEILKLLYESYPTELFKSDDLILGRIKPIIKKPSMLLDCYPTGDDRKRTDKKEKLKLNEELSKATLKIIQDYKFKSENLISQFKLNKLKLKILSKAFSSLRRTIYLLYFSLLCLVIYPLHFLPIPTTNDSFYTFDVKHIFSNILTFKNILLFSFFFIIGIIFFNFVIQIFSCNKKIKSVKDSLFDTYTNISNYSEHFRVISISGK